MGVLIGTLAAAMHIKQMSARVVAWLSLVSGITLAGLTIFVDSALTHQRVAGISLAAVVAAGTGVWFYTDTVKGGKNQGHGAPGQQQKGIARHLQPAIAFVFGLTLALTIGIVGHMAGQAVTALQHGMNSLSTTGGK